MKSSRSTAPRGASVRFARNGDPLHGIGGLLVDHDHRTKRIRAMICPACNTALGSMKDDPKRLRRAADYLEEHLSRAEGLLADVLLASESKSQNLEFPDGQTTTVRHTPTGN